MSDDLIKYWKALVGNFPILFSGSPFPHAPNTLGEAPPPSKAPVPFEAKLPKLNSDEKTPKPLKITQTDHTGEAMEHYNTAVPAAPVSLPPGPSEKKPLPDGHNLGAPAQGSAPSPVAFEVKYDKAVKAEDISQSQTGTDRPLDHWITAKGVIQETSPVGLVPLSYFMRARRTGPDPISTLDSAIGNPMLAKPSDTSADAAGYRATPGFPAPFSLKYNDSKDEVKQSKAGRPASLSFAFSTKRADKSKPITVPGDDTAVAGNPLIIGPQDTTLVRASPLASALSGTPVPFEVDYNTSKIPSRDDQTTTTSVVKESRFPNPSPSYWMGAKKPGGPNAILPIVPTDSAMGNAELQGPVLKGQETTVADESISAPSPNNLSMITETTRSNIPTEITPDVLSSNSGASVLSKQPLVDFIPVSDGKAALPISQTQDDSGTVSLASLADDSPTTHADANAGGSGPADNARSRPMPRFGSASEKIKQKIFGGKISVLAMAYPTAARPVEPAPPESNPGVSAKQAAEAAAAASKSKNNGQFKFQTYEPLWRAQITGNRFKVDYNMSHNKRQIELFNNLRIADIETDHMEKCAGYVFFTCTDMKLKPDAKSANADDNDRVQSVVSGIRQLNGTILDQLSGDNPDEPFMKVLTNMMQGFTPTDTVMEIRHVKETFQGYQMVVPTNPVKSMVGGSFQIEYLELEDGDITWLHKVWLDYIYAVKRGLVRPKDYNLDANVIDYASSMYYFVVAPDGMTLRYWAKYTGVIPTAVPYSAYSTSVNESTDIVKLTIPYEYSYKEDMDMAILADFARVSGSVQGVGSTVTDRKPNAASAVASPVNFNVILGGFQDILLKGISAFQGFVQGAATAVSNLPGTVAGALQQETSVQNTQNAANNLAATDSKSRDALNKIGAGAAGNFTPRMDSSANSSVRLERVVREQNKYSFILRFYNKNKDHPNQ
jgi:hypothetical protein